MILDKFKKYVLRLRTAKMGKDDAVILKVKELRRKAGERVKEQILEEYEEFKHQGKYPWEGLWVSPEEVKDLQRKIKKRDKIVFAEVIFLFIVILSLSFMLFKIMKAFVLP